MEVITNVCTGRSLPINAQNMQKYVFMFSRRFFGLSCFFPFSALHLRHVTFPSREERSKKWQTKDIKIAATDVFFVFVVLALFSCCSLLVLAGWWCWQTMMVWLGLRVSSAHLDKCFFCQHESYRNICTITTRGERGVLATEQRTGRKDSLQRWIPMRRRTENKIYEHNVAIIEVTVVHRFNLLYIYIFHTDSAYFFLLPSPLPHRCRLRYHLACARHHGDGCLWRMKMWECKHEREKINSNEKFNQGVWFKRIRSNI